MKLILASTSPRRRAILELLGVSFQVVAPVFVEHVVPERAIQDEVLDFALKKARSVAQNVGDSVVIGSDTMILINGEKIGKPQNLEDTYRILRLLSGKSHRIFTSVAIVDGLGGEGLMTVEEVAVRMRRFSENEIEDYLASGESLDKAGAYSIQGRGGSLIEAIDGDYLAAVGLPLRPIAGYLQGRGFVTAIDIERIYTEKSFANWGSF